MHVNGTIAGVEYVVFLTVFFVRGTIFGLRVKYSDANLTGQECEIGERLATEPKQFQMAIVGVGHDGGLRGLGLLCPDRA